MYIFPVSLEIQRSQNYVPHKILFLYPEAEGNKLFQNVSNFHQDCNSDPLTEDSNL